MKDSPLETAGPAATSADEHATSVANARTFATDPQASFACPVRISRDRCHICNLDNKPDEYWDHSA